MPDADHVVRDEDKLIVVEGEEDTGYVGIGPPESQDDINAAYASQQPGEKVMTAFLVKVFDDGRVVATGDLTASLEVGRPANLNDFVPACSQVIQDVQLMKITQNVVQNVIGNMMNLGKQAAEAAQAQQIRQALEAKGGFRGPGGMTRGL